MSREDFRRSWKPWLRGTAFGFPFGAMPAGGAEIPTFLSYTTEKRLSNRPEEFGHGAIEGVAGPEAANNASAAGTLVPMLTLGLPTTATAAVMLAAFTSYGIQPGPLLFDREPKLVWTLIGSLFIGNVLLLYWCSICRWRHAGRSCAYSVNAQAFDLALLFLLGLLSFMMRRYRLPLLPLIIGIILGPRAELQLRRTLQLSDGDISGLWSDPLAFTVYLVVGLIVLWPLINLVVHRFRSPTHPPRTDRAHPFLHTAQAMNESPAEDRRASPSDNQ